MTALDIITEARESLGDALGTGWEPTRLLSIINAGQRDICKEAKLVKEQAIVQLVNNRKIYELPSDCMQATRIEHKKDRVDVSSRDQLDGDKPYKGSFTILTDKLGMGLMEVFPVPSDVPTLQEIVIGPDVNLGSLDMASIFGVASTIGSPYIFNVVEGTISGGVSTTLDSSPASYGGLFVFGATDAVGTSSEYGVVVGNITTDITTDSGVYGVVVSTNLHEVDSPYGVVTSALTEDQYIKVFYNAAPNRIKSINDPLILPDLWVDAMVFYTIGMALSDDNDAGNLTRSGTFLRYYERELKTAIKLSSGAFSTTQSARTTKRRGIK